MPRIQLTFNAKVGYEYDNHTVEVEAKESEIFPDCIEIEIDRKTTIHVDKDELKKVVSLLCD